MTVTGAQWLETRERAAGSRLGRRRSDRLPGSGDIPPACNTPLAVGWCMLPSGHGRGHLPLPVSYPPAPTVVTEVAS